MSARGMPWPATLPYQYSAAPGGYQPQRQQRAGSGPSRLDELPAPQDNKEYIDDWFINVATWGNGNFTPGQSQISILQIQQDSMFELIEITASGNLHGQTPPFLDNVILPIVVQITDTGSNRTLFSAPLPMTLFAGSGKQPFILPISRMFQPLATVRLDATNTDLANTYDNVFLALIGRKIYDVTPPRY
jgi:hypothetical protein